MKPLILLGQIEQVFGEKPSKTYSYGLKEILIIIGVALALSAALFIWAAFWRKRRRTHSSNHHVEAQRGGEPSTSTSKRHRRRHRKASHPDKRPRNPTLAETGGLPPPRPEHEVPNVGLPNASQPNHNPQERL